MTATPSDTNSSRRGRNYLERLSESQGKRVVVDLDAQGKEALEKLLDTGYGISNKSVVNRALIDAVANNKRKLTKEPK